MEKFCYDHPHPAVTVDIIIFTIRNSELNLLLIERGIEPYKNTWALPGGFIKMDEDLEASARRELEEETGVSDVYLEQLSVYGKPDRDPRERVITIAYFALLASEKINLQAMTDAKDVGWFNINELPDLAFDHSEILTYAKKRLENKLNYTTAAFQFLNTEFTLFEVQQIYEIILQTTQDKRNFRKWILGLDIIEETGEMYRSGAYRPAKLYRYKFPGKVITIK